MSKYNMLVISIILMVILSSWLITNADEQSSSEKRNISTMEINNKETNKYLNYLRLPDGECYNCSTYKCTHHKSNLGGSEWCIMLFDDAIKHCNEDINCGGYTMTTAKWFHDKHDKNGQVAVHLNSNDKKTINCSLSEWSSYEKQNDIRSTQIIYGRSTCENRNKIENNNYVFVSNSNANNPLDTYLCKNHPNNLDNKDLNCILSISDGIKYCNEDKQCQGFMINIDENWQKKYSNNGMQAVQLYGQGATYTTNPIWRSFKKQF